MAREIKFRGFNRKNGVWLHGFYLQNRGAHFVCPDEFADGKSLDDYEIDPDTLGQYTGLKDKDGREIYEGDVVECVSWNEYFTNPETGQVMEPFRRKMTVSFLNGGFKMVEKMPAALKDNAWDIICNGDIKIIGNIHDRSATQGDACQSKNPELLKGKEGGI